MNRFVNSIIRLKWLIVLAVLALTIFFGYQLKNLSINPDVIDSLPNDDPTAKLFKDIGTEFAGNDMGMIVLETKDVFNAEVIQHVKQITDSIKYTPAFLR